ncbi:MAG: alpha-L-rhamnosidase [Clostridia bacterium]|nr:alpha-L-rhamnosidase [Clostridia bacterium]
MIFLPKCLNDSSVTPCLLQKIYIRPTRIVWHNEKATDCQNIIVNDDHQMMAGESVNVRNHAWIAPGGAVLIDFGKEICGGVKLFVRVMKDDEGKDKMDVSLRLRFGESANEAMAELHESGTTNDHNPRDFTVQSGVMSMAEFGYTGFRFVRIDNVDEKNTLLLQTVNAYAYFRDIEYKGSFRCDDEILNNVFDTAAYTLHLCMQDYIWDGIKRDRLVWIGDMYPEVATLCSVFGDDVTVRRSLDIVRDHTAPDKFMNTIITYNAWWVLCHYRYFMQNGDIAYLREQHIRLVELTRQLSEFIREDGSFDAKYSWALFDWPSNHSREMSDSGVHAIFKLTFEAAAFMLEELHDSENAAFCAETAKKIASFDYPDYDYKQIAAMRVFAGLRRADDENKRLLSQNGASGISTFLGMFTFGAMSEAGNTEGAVECIKGMYGKMLEIGATSFWEDFDPAWCDGAGRIDELTPEGLDDIHGDRGAYCYVGFRHSLCHGWSSGVAAYMSEYLLGIKIKAPGCRKVEISPCKCGLKYIEGTYPTPYGEIFVRHTLCADGKYKTSYTAPKEVEVAVK